MSRRRLRAAAAAAAATRTLVPAFAAATAASPRWTRSNYRGRPVSLAAGPAVALATGAATLFVAAEPGAAFAAAAGAALGCYDDIYGDSHARGLRGHVAALRSGRVTTGVIKLAGLAGAAVASSLLERRGPRALVGDVVLVAGAANLLNLLDLRPGRALKAVTAAGAMLGGSGGGSAGVAAATVGGAAAALAWDLDERTMIGDCGANSLGALLGWCLSRGLSGTGRATAMGVVVGLTLASERVSFTQVIDRTPVLAAIDGLGRQR